MDRHLLASVWLAVSLIASGHAWGQVAGDPVRGNSLFRLTYGCSNCHSIMVPNDPARRGTTADVILNAINTVLPMRQRFQSTLATRPVDLADIAAYILQSTSPPAALDINQHGLTGSWYNQATDGQGMVLEFFVDAVAPGTAYLQGAWFTYDTVVGGVERQRWYTYSGNAQSGAASIAVTLYQNIGGNFNAPPTTNATAVGSGTLSFSDCTTGRFDYTFTDGSARSGSIPLTRLTRNMTCAVAAERAINPDFGFSGNWYDPATSGQGLVIEANPASATLFVTWYTYAAAGQTEGAAGQRWYTAQAAFGVGMRSIPVTLYETTGGAFNQATAPAPATNAVGTGTVTFASCTSASLSYNFTGGGNVGKSGTIQLARVGPTPAGCGP